MDVCSFFDSMHNVFTLLMGCYFSVEHFCGIIQNKQSIVTATNTHNAQG